jgi:DNA-binding transcriptional LysR family regulator
MELRQIEAFVSIATLRNFRAAANRLHITQPAVSQRLASLEAEIEAQLLERGGNQVQLTPKGMQLLQTAEQLLDLAQKLKLQAAGEQPALQRIRIGLTDTIANAWMSALYVELTQVFPHLAVELAVSTSPQLRSLLVGGELDLALIMGPTHSAGVRNLPLARYGTAWVAARGWRLPRKMSLPQLAKHRIITHARDSATYGSLEELFRNRGLWPVEISTTNSMGALLRIAESGAAIGAVCTACLDKDALASSLRMLQCDDELPWFEFFASYHLDSVGRVGMMVAEMAQKVCWEAAGNTPLTSVSR